MQPWVGALPTAVAAVPSQSRSRRRRSSSARDEAWLEIVRNMHAVVSYVTTVNQLREIIGDFVQAKVVLGWGGGRILRVGDNYTKIKHNLVRYL